MIRFDRVTKRFGRFTAVDDVSLEVGRGECLALWGANGAGKSTMIRCMLGLHRFKGVISVDGLDVRRQGRRARRLIGYVPQELGFSDDATVKQSIDFFAGLKGVAVPRLDECLGAVGLAGQGHKRLRELSGGMKQRLALCLALLGDPPVLVLDEVTASLDAAGREELVMLLSRLAHSGRTMLFASHRQEEVMRLATTVAVLERGRVDRRVAPAELFGPAAPANEEVVLRLMVDQPTSQRALQVLRDRGHEAYLNGVGVLVAVASPRRAAPFEILAHADIPVKDFEFVEPASPCMTAARSAAAASNKRGER